MMRPSVEAAIKQAMRLLESNQYQTVIPLVESILERDPRNVTAYWLRARIAAAIGKPLEAANWLKAILDVVPNDLRVIEQLAAIAVVTENLEQAIQWHRQLVQLEPANAARLYNLACILQQVGADKQAADLYRRAIELEPGFGQAHNNLGNILFASNQYALASDSYKKAALVDATSTDAHYNLALCYQRLGDVDSAENTLRAVLARHPEFWPAMLTLGSICHDKHDLSCARHWYRKVIAAEPANLEALYNLGTLCLAQEEYTESLGYFARAMETINWSQMMADSGQSGSVVPLEPSPSLVHFNMGRVFLRMGKTREWLAHYHAYNLQSPDANNLQYGLEVAIHEGRHEEAERLITVLLDRLPDIHDAEQISHLLSLLQYQDVQQSDLLACYRRFNALALAETRGRRLTPAPEAGDRRRIRLGYLSPDFNRHVMGYLMHEVLGRHDRERFELYLYDSGKKDDEMTAGFRSLCDRFVTVRGLAPEQAARRIAQDRLDILVDLAGHTSGGMPLVLAYKPARVQLTHLGYHGALGLETVDYKITDDYADLPDNAGWLVEGLLPMAGCLMPFRHQEPAPEGPGRRELGIADDAVVFGEFVTHRKLSRRCLAAWRAILDRVPVGVLAFSTSNETEAQAIRNNLERAGIPEGRVVFLPYSGDPAAGRARYRLVDIVLDTFPYTGGDTTLAALDMGVPVVTLCGTRQSERVTYSILRNLGVDVGVAHSEADYVELACRLAEDKEFRSDYARAITGMLPGSVLADMDAYTRHLEDAYGRALEGASDRDGMPVKA